MSAALKLFPGMLIATGYGSGPYRIKRIERGCTCPTYLDSINYRQAPKQAPHMHIECTLPDGTGKFYLSHYSEETLRCVYRRYDGTEENCAIPASKDHLIILENDNAPIQLQLF